MGIRQSYRRYRTWASGFDQRGCVELGAAGGAIGASIVSVTAMTGAAAFLDVFPYVLAIGGVIAAADAYGAESWRGARGRGIIRAMVILVLTWAWPGYLLLARPLP